MVNNTYDIDIKKLLESGAHFGHKTSRWHPKMAEYIHSKRDGSHIIDLTKTVTALQTALIFLETVAENNKQILLISTKKQAKDIINNLAKETDMPFVSERWLGGMLTNSNTINGRIRHLKDLEAKLASGELNNKYNKLEVQRFNEEINELNRIYGGIKELNGHPGAIFILDVNNDNNAVTEANKLGIKTVGIVDTNTDPSKITYPIPANDDALKTLNLIADLVKQAILNGKAKASKANTK